MSRAPLVRALIALAILAGSIYFAVTTPARLGLDLRGGTQIVLETQDSPTVKADERVHRPRGRGAAPPGRRARRRRAHPHPLRRPADHRRAARRAGPARGRRGDRPDRAADLPPGARHRDADPHAEPVASGSESPSPSPSASPSAEEGELVLPDEGGQPTCGSAARPLTGERDRGARRPSSTRRVWAAGSSPSTSRARAGRPGRSSPARPPVQPPGDPGAASRSCSTTRSSPRRRSTRRSPCDVGIPGGSTQITGDFTPGGGQGAGGPDPRRRAAGAGRGHRAADRRRRPSAPPPSRPAPRPRSSVSP